MSTADLIHTMRQGATITPKLVRRIIAALESTARTATLFRSLLAEHEAQRASQKNKIMFTREECGHLGDVDGNGTVTASILDRTAVLYTVWLYSVSMRSV